MGREGEAGLGRRGLGKVLERLARAAWGGGGGGGGELGEAPRGATIAEKAHAGRAGVGKDITAYSTKGVTTLSLPLQPPLYYCFWLAFTSYTFMNLTFPFLLLLLLLPPLPGAALAAGAAAARQRPQRPPARGAGAAPGAEGACCGRGGLRGGEGKGCGE